MKEYYYLIVDHGDGSCGLRFFKKKDVAQYKLEHPNEDDNEFYWYNEEVGVLLADNLDVDFQDV